VSLKRNDASGAHQVSQILNGRPGKNTFVRVNHKAMLREQGNHLAEMEQVIFPGGTGDQDIIQINKAVRQAIKYAVHEALEGLRCILEAERHT